MNVLLDGSVRYLCGLAGLMMAVAGRDLPPGLVESEMAHGIDGAVTMVRAPDGRIFICEQNGKLRVFKDGVLLPEPFVALETEPLDEQGLIGVELDPEFAQNHFIYLNCTTMTPPKRQQIFRFTAEGDRAQARSRTLIFELDDELVKFHCGGALRFGKDGKLYVATGDSSRGDFAPSLTSLHGKVLRLNRDGSIPGDNPFFARAEGKNRAIWVKGLRNAFALAVHPADGRIFINDVGNQDFEEINEGRAGADFGWPDVRGHSERKEFTDPVHFYPRSEGICIGGGVFYAPESPQLGARFAGMYFFCEYGAGIIKFIDSAHPEKSQRFCGSAHPGPIDLIVAPDGALYYLARGNNSADGGTGGIHADGRLYRITAEKSAVAAPK